MHASNDRALRRWIVVSFLEIFNRLEKLRRWGMVCDHAEHQEQRREGKKHVECTRTHL